MKKLENQDKLKVEVTVLTKEYLLEKLEHFLSIERICFPDQFWSKENFLKELPGKWSLSKVCVPVRETNETKVIGYIVASRYGQKIGHIHRFAVHPLFQGLEIGSLLMRQLVSRAFQQGIIEITVESNIENTEANSIYKRMGFKEFQRAKTLRYLSLKGKILHANSFHVVDDTGIRCVYSLNLIGNAQGIREGRDQHMEK